MIGCFDQNVWIVYFDNLKSTVGGLGFARYEPKYRGGGGDRSEPEGGGRGHGRRTEGEPGATNLGKQFKTVVDSMLKRFSRPYLLRNLVLRVHLPVQGCS